MEKEKVLLSQQEQEGRGFSPVDKKPWQEPKLAFVEPKLTEHGKLDQVTSGFFCGFDPPRP